MKAQKELDKLEREKFYNEHQLNQLDENYRTMIKKGGFGLSPFKSSEKRSQIEQYKNELSNLNSHISILAKKKDMLVDELKTIVSLERRFSTSVAESDGTLKEMKRELQEIKTGKNLSARNTIKFEPKETP
jgi:hypothetical protein